MDDPSESTVDRDLGHRLRSLLRVFWNGAERRLRAPVRLVLGFLLFLVLAGAGTQYRPTLLGSDGAIPTVVNMLSRQLPNSLGLALAVVLAAILIDRRRLTDLGLDVDRGWLRGLAGGTLIGAGITLLAVLVGLGAGYYEVTSVGLATGPGVWTVVAVSAALFQLLVVVPEELFVRGYVITNVSEGLDGVPSVPRSVAVGTAIVVSSALFYVTHAAAKGTVFGLMVAVLSLLLGIGFVLGGDLSVPIGVHFGVNFAGVLAGLNPQPASLLELSAATTVQESLVLPVEAVAVRLAGAVVGIAVLWWWYHTRVGRIRVAPTVTRPALRWRASRDGTDD